MTRIIKISLFLADCKLAAPAVFATRAVKSRQYLLVRLSCDNGHEGIGASYCGDSAGEISFQAARDLLAPMLMHQDPYLVEGHWQAMYQQALLHGRTGSVMRALAALDTALWDHNARAAGLPLWKFLGSFHDGRVPAYASGGYYNQDRDIDTLCSEMANYVAGGFKAVKMKVGRAAVSTDRERVAAVRETVGPDVDLMLDANNAWKNVPDALRFLQTVEQYTPYWIEEPFSPDAIGAHAKLAGRTTIPIAGGEVEAGRWRFRDLIERDAVQIAQPDMFACGGVTEWRRIAAYASACDVPVCTHAWQDFHAPLMAAAPNALRVEFFTDNRIVNLQDLLDHPLVHEDGDIVLSQAAGFGFDFDQSRLDSATLIGWTQVAS